MCPRSEKQTLWVYPPQSMRLDAADALEEMFAAAKAQGIRLATVSGYRSYTKQNTIYKKKVKSTGVEIADTLVALPGSSEHQLGLAMDVAKHNNSSLTSGFAKTAEGAMGCRKRASVRLYRALPGRHGGYHGIFLRTLAYSLRWQGVRPGDLRFRLADGAIRLRTSRGNL